MDKCQLACMDVNLEVCNCSELPETSDLFDEKDCQCGGLLGLLQCGEGKFCLCFKVTINYKFLSLQIGDVYVVVKLICGDSVIIDGKCVPVAKCKNTMELCACGCVGSDIENCCIEVTMVVKGFKCKQVITKKIQAYSPNPES